jgi:hypothetical protein
MTNNSLTPEQRRAVTEWLAKVMGWELRTTSRGGVLAGPVGGGIFCLSGPSFMPRWSPLDSWQDAGQVWEKAQFKGYYIKLCNQQMGSPWFADVQRCNDISFGDSGPLAISLAVFRATGGKLDG